MTSITDFSKGLIPLKYNIFKHRSKRLTKKDLLTILVALSPFILGVLLMKFFGRYTVFVAIIPFIIYLFFKKKTWEYDKLGHLQFTDSELIINYETKETTFSYEEIKRMDFKNASTTKGGTPLTFYLTLKFKSGNDKTFHVDRTPEIEDRPKHFYSIPPSLELTLSRIEDKFRIKVWYDRT